MNEKLLPVMGTGNETRDYTYVEDIVDGLLRGGVFPKAVGEAINLGSGVETSVIELAKMINDITNNPKGVEYRSKRSWDASNRRVASIEKAKRILGYDPKIKIKDGLVKTYGWFKDKWDLIKKDAMF